MPARYVEGIRQRRRSQGIPAGSIHGFDDGERLSVHGTAFEVFTLPGHTPDSIAVLARGVLFLGDSAASLYDGTLRPTTMMSEDPAQTVRSLASLAERLAGRRNEIRHLACGHQGPLDGLEPLLDWSAGREQ